MALPIKQRIKFACGISKINLSKVAESLGMSPSAFSQRLDKAKFTKDELVKIAEIIGCKYDCYFRFGDGSVFRAPTIGQQIKDALEHSGMTIADLATKMKLTRQAASKRLSIGKLCQDDLEEIARYMGCDYVSVFEFEDGTEI